MTFKNWKLPLLASVVFSFLFSCSGKKESDSAIKTDSIASGFKADVDFLKKYTEIIVLEDSTGKSKIAISPALQGRVMTSTSDGDSGLSYGWINREAFISGDTSEHMNAFGGEDRFWLGPEGGQFSLYFSKGSEFTLDNWHVPPLIDTEPFITESSAANEVVFVNDAMLTNYSETDFNFGIERKVRLIPREEARQALAIGDGKNISLIGYESINTIFNTGSTRWKKSTGLLSIWILGMFKHSDNTTVVIPYRARSNPSEPVVNDAYFGKVPADRLKLDSGVIYFKGDGKFRSKIGLKPDVATEWIGSYDADNGVLTLVKYTKPEGVEDYVNSFWAIQTKPYEGDAVNAYNDGPPAPGAKPLGPFYELESSSPAAALPPEKSITHVHTTYHLRGTPEVLDPIMKKILGVDSKAVAAAFK